MVHTCGLSLPEDDALINRKQTKGHRWWTKLIMINASYPCVHHHFRSESSIKKEKIRHLTSGYLYIIHPLSKFSQWYDVWLIFLYLTICILKPIDSCTRRGPHWGYHTVFSVVVDVISWSDIGIKCFMGYNEVETRTIVLHQGKIIKRYVKSPFFVPDVLGSLLPRYSLYIFSDRPNVKLLGVQVLICLLRPIRIITAVQLIHRVGVYTLNIAKTKVFIVCCMVIFFFTLNYVTCVQISLGRLIRIYWQNDTDFHDMENLYTLNDLYIEYMFRSSAYLLGIALPEHYFEQITNNEEYVVAIATYIIGKILIASTWIILVQSILNANSMRIKFQGILNQLDEYMKLRQLPLHLQDRIREYYIFKYQNEFFKDFQVTNLLSESLNQEVNMDICRLLVSKVTLFNELSVKQIGELVPLLVSEIYMIGDCIIQAHTPGDSMYFLASGTVAVYTQSGKEVCHLEDGAYFGEISLVVKGHPRCASITAVETCRVYKLHRRDFERTLFKDKFIFQGIINVAERRLKETMYLDNIHKKSLFEKTYTYYNADAS